MIRGFVDSDAAYHTACNLDRVGLKNHRYTCCPVELLHGRGWAYWTSHDRFSPDQDPGTLLLDGGEVNLWNYDSLASILDIPEEDVVEWIEHNLFTRRVTVENLTENEIQHLKHARTEEEWNKVCDEVKARRSGEYPPDWYSRVVQSGLMADTVSRFEDMK